MTDTHDLITSLFEERILVLDGAMGTMVQRAKPTEADYRGARFADHPSDLKGNNDLLVLTKPELVRDIHLQYLDAGADFIETNTFNANAISQEDYGLQALAYELNVEAAKLAKQAAVDRSTKDRPRFALGALPALTARLDQIKAVRKTVLNLAVRGKLVEQDPADEPASELLKRIKLERASHPSNQKRRSTSSIAAAAIGFEVPSCWTLTTLGEISLRLHYGYTASASKTDKNVRLLRITDIQNDRVEWNNVPGCEIDSKAFSKYELHSGDLLIARTGGTIGKTFLVSDVPVKSVFASYLIRVQPAHALYSPYIKLFCGSDIYWDQLSEGSRGGGQPNVNGKTLGKMNFPLPPLAEQRRIVAKVDELMALCDRLENALNNADETRARLLQALLHEAIEPAAASNAALKAAE